MEKYYTSDELAELLHISKTTIRNRAKADPTFKLTKTGNKLLMSESDLQAYLNASRDRAERENEERRQAAEVNELPPRRSLSAEQRTDFFYLVKQPPEYFNGILNSGMCNEIITGYIYLAFDQLGISAEKLNTERLFDTYTAHQARQRVKLAENGGGSDVIDGDQIYFNNAPDLDSSEE